jgi:hypothetical protein
LVVHLPKPAMQAFILLVLPGRARFIAKEDPAAKRTYLMNTTKTLQLEGATWFHRLSVVRCPWSVASRHNRQGYPFLLC